MLGAKQYRLEVLIKKPNEFSVAFISHFTFPNIYHNSLILSFKRSSQRPSPGQKEQAESGRNSFEISFIEPGNRDAAVSIFF